MLNSLFISNIVLIKKLNLEFGTGLNVLTGETGAGKSILLDALSLALGARSDIGLIRHGAERAQVVAEFSIAKNTNISEILHENEIEFDDTLILRRIIELDGKSRAWINDIPVSIKILKQIGDFLIEIHGQFENHSLLDPTTHRTTLDEFSRGNMSDYENILTQTRSSYKELYSAQNRLKELENLLARAESEREFLRHNVAELESLNPQIGEEEDLANQRSILMHAEKNSAILKDAVQSLNHNGNTIESQIFNAAHILQRIKNDPNPYSEQIDVLYRAAEMISDVSDKLTPPNTDARGLEEIEERLFAIRAAARKHRISGDELNAKLNEMRSQLESIDNSDAELKKLKSDVKNKSAEFGKYAKQLTQMRKISGENMRTQILAEFPDLKLGQADFMVNITETSPGVHGSDEITFMIKTNPGTPFAPLHKIASGGELARLMLALRVVLTDNNNPRVFVFDEVDTGISGATASAVGDRLNRLAQNNQALVITHSAQVAGFADCHFKIEKHSDNNSTITTVCKIDGADKIAEIARIISGTEITSESIATARTLIK